MHRYENIHKLSFSIIIFEVLTYLFLFPPLDFYFYSLQAETYRKMQKATKNEWQNYTPITNAFWMRYLADITLANKLPAGCSDENRLSLRNFRKAAAVANKAGDLVWHDLFAGKWTSGSDNPLGKSEA